MVTAFTTTDDAVSGASTKLYELTLDRGASFDAAQDQLRAGRANARPGDNDPASTRRSFRGAGFYISNHTNTRTKRPYIMMAVRKANAAQTFLITRPNTGANATELFAHDIISKYTCHAGGLPSASDEEREQLLEGETTGKHAPALTTQLLITKVFLSRCAQEKLNKIKVSSRQPLPPARRWRRTSSSTKSLWRTTTANRSFST